MGFFRSTCSCSIAITNISCPEFFTALKLEGITELFQSLGTQDNLVLSKQQLQHKWQPFPKKMVSRFQRIHVIVKILFTCKIMGTGFISQNKL